MDYAPQVTCRECEKTGPVHKFIRFGSGDKRTYVCKSHVKCSSCAGSVSGTPIFTVGDKAYHKSCRNKVEVSFCSTCQSQRDLPFVFEKQKYCSTKCIPCYYCKISDSSVTGMSCLVFGETRAKMIRCHTECYDSSLCDICNLPFPLDTFVRGEKKEHVYCRICFFCDKSDDQIYRKKNILGFRVYYHQFCSKIDICGCCNDPIINTTALAPETWNTKSHNMYPKEIKDAIFAFTLVSKRLGLYKDVTRLISSYIATFDGWPILGGEKVKGSVCTPWLCKHEKDPHCRVCDSQIKVFAPPNTCYQHVCLKFAFKCSNCNEPVPFTADPCTSCTMYRCKNERCSLCDGELSYGNEDTRSICTRQHCKVYVAKCKRFGICGNNIKRYPICLEEECTEYRCVTDECTKCGNILAPYSSGYKGCTRDRCFTLSQTYNKLTDILIRKLDEGGHHLNRKTMVFANRLKVHVVAFMAELLENNSPLYKEIKEIYDLWLNVVKMSE